MTVNEEIATLEADLAATVTALKTNIAAVAERDKRIAELEEFVATVAGLPGSCSRQICGRARALTKGY